MTLADKIRADMEQALRNREQARLSVLRLLLSAFNYYEIEKQKKIDDNGVIDVLSREAKKRRESIEAFEKGNRTDLVNKEKFELEIISSYLPKQLDSEEITRLIKDTISEMNIKSPADKGRLMSKIMPLLKGKADSKQVNTIVDEILKTL